MSDEWICNGKADLLNGLDEQNCDKRNCPFEFRNCDNNKCVPPDQVCDGKLNCFDGNDEMNCTECYKTCDGTCIAHSQICDGHIDCKDKSDESSCYSWHCLESFWKCADGKCIPIQYVCDTFADCADESDEKECENWNCTEGSWKCADQKQCIPIHTVCDHAVTCQDASDEGDLCYGEWKCPPGLFTCTKQHTVCLSPKYVCDGRDEIYGCGHTHQDEEDCEEWNCTEGYWKCEDNKQCVPFAEVCDGKHHCHDKSDEFNCERFTCPENQWKCLNTRNCIEPSQVCDGQSDCPNNSDKKGKNKNYANWHNSCPILFHSNY